MNAKEKKATTKDTTKAMTKATTKALMVCVEHRHHSITEFYFRGWWLFLTVAGNHND